MRNTCRWNLNKNLHCSQVLSEINKTNFFAQNTVKTFNQNTRGTKSTQQTHCAFQRRRQQINGRVNTIQTRGTRRAIRPTTAKLLLYTKL